MNPAEEAFLAKHVAGMAVVASHRGTDSFWIEWSKFVQQYKNNGLLIRELDPMFYVDKVWELTHNVFSP